MKTYSVLTKKDFGWITWTKEDILALTEGIVARKKSILTSIKEIADSARTFENTLAVLERSDNENNNVISQLHVLLNASPDVDIRNACEATITTLSDALTDLSFDEDIYKAIVTYANKKEPLLDPSDAKLLADTLDGYRRLGFGLTKQKRDRVQKLFKTLNNTAQTFGRAINDWRGSITVTKQDLAGTPESYQASLENNGDMYTVTSDYPSMNPFMMSARSSAKRKELFDIVQQKGGKNNLKLLSKMIALRTDIAKTLGYASWAHYQLEDKLVQTPKNARTIIASVLKNTKATYKKELQLLENAKKKVSKEKLSVSDVAYFENIVRQELYAVDQNEIREHLPLKHVIQTMLTMFGNLFGIAFVATKKFPMWHPDVICYEVTDTKSKEVLAYLLLDLYPRIGKYSHAAAFQTIEQGQDPKTKLYGPQVITLMCNFAKPTKGMVSLLSHNDAETLFHEFGHAMHHMLSKVKYVSQTGFKVKYDFVEVPSQLLEHWMWNKKVLQKITKHYATGEALSNKKIDALLASEKYMDSYMWRRQMVQTLLALDIHEKNITVPLNTYFQTLAKDILGFTYTSTSLFPAGFGHMDGYAAAYYVYVYSKMYCDDFASVFKKSGMENKNVGLRYRTEILEVGASREESVSVERFLGRPINIQAFLDNLL